ncbi:MAG: hypothetical protein CMJ58_04350 [Planctomycetaceae bacterium]|nr:hypothetical protein [Planctomycetaceae bacterium]
MTIERHIAPGRPRRVLLVGWDAADWQMIQPLIERGQMPTLAAMLEQGAWGNLATLRPILSPLLWNTVATGKRAPEHGVLGFLEADAEGTGVRPSSSTSRQCKALWNILTQCGLRTNVVGWYASHPAEPIAGAVATNQFETSHLKGGVAAPVPPGAVHPPELAEELASLRVHPREIDATAILPFIPAAAELLAKPGHRVGKLQQLIAQTATIHAVATHLMATTEWDLTAIYYEGIDRCGHEFMHCHPPQMEQTSDEEFAAYQHCMVGIYRFHDMLLETLLKLAGDDTAVILMSDHGYYNDHLRPDPREGKSGPVDWHRPFGIFAAQGPGIQPGARAYGASLLEIAPTVLELLGLPPAYDMPGRVLAEVLIDATLRPRIESWEEIDGECGMHPPETRVDPAEAAAMLEQLADLGYIEAPGDDGEHSVAQTVACNQVTLAQALMDAQRFPAAIEVLRGIDEPSQSAASLALLEANCLIAIGRRDEARAVLQNHAERLDQSPRWHMMLGTLEFAEQNHEAALAHYQQVLAAEPRLPDLHNKLGEVYLTVKRYDEAVEAFSRALQVDGESPIALAGLARAELARGEPQAALDHGLAAAELVHHFPRVHLVIGEARLALGDFAGAVEALELCVKQAPKFPAAHESLAAAYRNLGRREDAMAAELRAQGMMK